MLEGKQRHSLRTTTMCSSGAGREQTDYRVSFQCQLSSPVLLVFLVQRRRWSVRCGWEHVGGSGSGTVSALRWAQGWTGTDELHTNKINKSPASVKSSNSRFYFLTRLSVVFCLINTQKTSNKVELFHNWRTLRLESTVPSSSVHFILVFSETLPFTVPWKIENYSV